MTNQDWILELKQRVDIVNVISSYISLEKKGNSYWGICPFHAEKTPSFSVNSMQQFYKCFGCGKAGDVFNFVMEIEGISFIEAAKILADKYNFKIPEIAYNEEKNRAETKLKERMQLAMREAAVYYRNNLYTEEGKPYLAYIKNRGISDEIITRHFIGASIGAQNIISYMKNKGFGEDILEKCGILSKKDDRYYDAQYNRLIFPIFNQIGNVVAFGGRMIVKTDFAKYKNTNETLLFKKGNTVYGLNFIKDLRLNGEFDNSLILVEGYMDVVGMANYGIKNAAAGMGTAFTDSQAILIKRACETVYVCYDGDNAGKKAANSAVDVLYNKNINVRVICLPEELDPDEYLKKYGAEKFLELKNNAPDIFEFKINMLAQTYDLSSFEGRGVFSSKAINALKIIKDKVMALPYLELIAKYSQLDLQDIKASFLKTANPIPNPHKSDVERIIKEDISDKYKKSLNFCLYAISNKRKYANLDDIKSYIIDDYAISIGLILAEKLPKFEKFNVGMLSGFIPDDVFNDLIKAENYIESSDEIDKYEKEKSFYEDCVKNVIQHYYDFEIGQLTSRLKDVKSNTEKTDIVLKISTLSKKKKEISNKN